MTGCIRIVVIISWSFCHKISKRGKKKNLRILTRWMTLANNLIKWVLWSNSCQIRGHWCKTSLATVAALMCGRQKRQSKTEIRSRDFISRITCDHHDVGIFSAKLQISKTYFFYVIQSEIEYVVAFNVTIS